MTCRTAFTILGATVAASIVMEVWILGEIHEIKRQIDPVSEYRVVHRLMPEPLAHEPVVR